MPIWRSIHVANNKKVEKFHNSQEEAEAYWKAQIADDHFAPVFGMKGITNGLRAQKLVELIPEYEIKIAGMEDHITEFNAVK